MLSINNINVSYGKVQVLHDVSLKVNEGEICALFGRNGAGKTTLLKSYVGLLPITNGSVKFNNKEITNMEADKVCALGIGLAFQERMVFPTLSVMEHFKLATTNAFNGKDLDKILKEVLDLFPDLKPHVNDRGVTLSGGEAQMVKLAMAIVRRPKLLLLDEPLTGLSGKNVHKLTDKLHELKGEMTVLIAEQNIRSALELADNFLIIKDGTIIHQDTVKDINKDEEVVRKYILS